MLGLIREYVLNCDCRFKVLYSWTPLMHGCDEMSANELVWICSVFSSSSSCEAVLKFFSDLNAQSSLCWLKSVSSSYLNFCHQHRIHHVLLYLFVSLLYRISPVFVIVCLSFRSAFFVHLPGAYICASRIQILNVHSFRFTLYRVHCTLYTHRAF